MALLGTAREVVGELLLGEQCLEGRAVLGTVRQTRSRKSTKSAPPTPQSLTRMSRLSRMVRMGSWPCPRVRSMDQSRLRHQPLAEVLPERPRRVAEEGDPEWNRTRNSGNRSQPSRCRCTGSHPTWSSSSTRQSPRTTPWAPPPGSRRARRPRGCSQRLVLHVVTELVQNHRVVVAVVVSAAHLKGKSARPRTDSKSQGSPGRW